MFQLGGSTKRRPLHLATMLAFSVIGLLVYIGISSHRHSRELHILECKARNSEGLRAMWQSKFVRQAHEHAIQSAESSMESSYGEIRRNSIFFQRLATAYQEQLQDLEVEIDSLSMLYAKHCNGQSRQTDNFTP